MKGVFICLLCTITTSGLAQLGGKKSFEFLNVPNNARLAGLGGVNVSLADKDINFAFSNPTLAGDTLSGFASANYQFYVADIGQTTVAYAHDFKKSGPIVFGIQHLGYGRIKGYDATGAELGEYRSGETALFVGKSHQISNFRFGAAVKFAFSSIACYRANALMVDLGGLFIHPEQDFSIGIAVKNLGLILSDYTETSTSELPFDVRIGATLKPEHMPLRFSITAYNLTNNYGAGMAANSDDGTLKKILRHVNFGTEILIHRNVNLLVGYNYLVHQELKLENAGGIAGICFGFSANIRSFQFAFSRSAYVIGNASYAFSVSKNINTILSRG